MELNLVWVKDKETGRTTYFAVNDKHYDAMLACGGCWEIEKRSEWGWLGSVEITEEILNEQGYYFKED